MEDGRFHPRAVWAGIDRRVRDSAETLARQTPVSLYFHIPFCKVKCIYCDFYSVVNRDEQIPRFLQMLLREFRDSRPLLERYDVSETVYLGGGTPSMLSGAQLNRLLNGIREVLPLAPDAEITLEANPGEVDLPRLRDYRQAGVNRVSFGLQSFDDSQLELLGRLHRSGQNVPAVTMAREAGFENVSVDLLFHLPGQSLEDFRTDLEQIVALDAEHISIYSLTIERNTPLFQYVQDGRIRMTPDDLDAGMYLLLCEEMEAAGYEHYEVSNFSKPGYHSRHNSNYWNGRHYLGYGPSAHSYDGRHRWWNVRDLSKYLNRMQGSSSPIEKKESLDKVTLQHEYLLTRLRTSAGIDRKDWHRTFGEPFPDNLADYLSELTGRQPQWVDRTPKGWRLTRQGWLFNDSIIQECADRLTCEEAV